MLDCFSGDERQRLLALQANDAFAAAILDHTYRIVRSPHFERLQPRAKHFLIWVVGKRLLGEIDQIKESLIAVAVFGEPADFDSSETSKIRVAAADLRERLKQFASLEGADDPLLFSIPTNTYVPQIVERTSSVDIVALDNWSACDRDGHVRDAFVGELMLRLSECGVRTSRGRTRDFGCTRQRYLLQGSFVCSNDVLYITVSLSDPLTQRTVFTETYQKNRDAILLMARTVSEDILNSFGHAALLA